MEAENKILVAQKLRNHRLTEATVIVVPAWAPQPNPLTPDAIRRVVIDRIG